MDDAGREQFEQDPAGFLKDAIEAYVASNPLNRLQAFGGAPIFDKPLLGFAGGDDPLFGEYKRIVGDFHLLPREALRTGLEQGAKNEPARVTVISWVLPFEKQVYLSNRKEISGPSLRWNHARWHGQGFIEALSRHLIGMLRKAGYRAVAPERLTVFKMLDSPEGLTSTWSQRHVAYAAGLGTFGLSDGFITARGMAMRCDSLVTDVWLETAPRPYRDHHSNCLFYSTGKCGRCIERCPGKAISKKGHDKKKCVRTLLVDQRPWMEGAHGSGYIGRYAGCGLCQTKVPCEHQIPATETGQST